MYFTRLILQNWRNFRELDVPLRDRTYLLGPNASGKSNLLDVFRFLRDISKFQGGGIQKAIKDRGEIKKLRCLHARIHPEVRIEVHISEKMDDQTPAWRYLLEFKPEGVGAQRPKITAEKIWKGNKLIINRPDSMDKKDTLKLLQTHMEQLQVNSDFRELASFFSETTYLHLVPQLIKFNDLIGGRPLEEDPFGQGFLERIAKTPNRTRDSRLKKINAALGKAIPQFKELQFEQDRISGRPHLKALYAHHRPNAGWQREEQFSDGTLRLIGLFWSLLEGDSLLLLEEPELSLNDAIVREIPGIFDRVLRNKKRNRQLIISTHSEALLSNKGIDGRGVLILEPGSDGTKVRSIDESEAIALRSGFSVAEAVLPKSRPNNVGQLGLW